MKPVIGISCDQKNNSHEISLRREYVTVISDNGGLPVLIPVNEQSGILQNTLEHCHGLLLTGGGDIDPCFYGSQKNNRVVRDVDQIRDSFEISLIQIALQQKKPILAICRGMQVLNISLNGSLYQELHKEIFQVGCHQPVNARRNVYHPVKIAIHSHLYQLLGEEITVNSNHHQAVRDLGKNLIVSGVSPDGVVEAIEGDSELSWVVGVQWHPERLTGTLAKPELFRAFLKEAAKIFEI